MKKAMILKRPVKESGEVVYDSEMASSLFLYSKCPGAHVMCLFFTSTHNKKKEIILE